MEVKISTVSQYGFWLTVVVRNLYGSIALSPLPLPSPNKSAKDSKLTPDEENLYSNRLSYFLNTFCLYEG